MVYETVIGMEVHAELSTKSKIFCGCSTEFGGEPNSHCCPICTAMPGTLPVLNEKVVEYAVKAGLAMNCSVAGFSKADRKNYFYPDLPKAYQISQYDRPICQNGYIEIEVCGIRRKIGIERIHIEEDAGKLIHNEEGKNTLIDYNRSGVPLIEIVSRPDIRSPEEAKAFVESIKAILEYLDICDCKMQEGSLRADVNLSVRPKGSNLLGNRTEMKNLNSLRAIQHASFYESQRQICELTKGRKITQETRRWDEVRECTIAMRSKEEALDYRYFFEPDLVPVIIDEEWIESIRASLPELPTARRDRFIEEYGLPEYDADFLTSQRRLADFFEEGVRDGDDPKALSNWIMGELMRALKDKKMNIVDIPFPGSYLSKLILLINSGKISMTAAKKVFEEMLDSGKEPHVIVREQGLEIVNDEDELLEIIRQIIKDNPRSVSDYKSGKEKAFGFLVGQLMKKMRGKADPKAVSRLMQYEIDKQIPLT